MIDAVQKGTISQTITEFQKGNKSLLLLDQSDIRLYSDVLQYKTSCATLLGENAQFISYIEEEVRNVKEAFYKRKNADAIINFLYDLGRYDIILVYSAEKEPEAAERSRKMFETALLKDGLIIEREQNIQKTESFLKIFVPFERLGIEAHRLKLRFPLAKNNPILNKSSSQFNIARLFEDKIEMNEITAPFHMERINEFRNGNEVLKPYANIVDEFFTTSKRQLMAHNILQNSKIVVQKKGRMKRILFRKLLDTKVFVDFFILHEGKITDENSPRGSLYFSWVNMTMRQPIEQVKSYFGENVALYFAWLDFYTSSLKFAALVGAIFFALSLVSALSNTRGTFVVNLFDNVYTLPFSIFISVWSTVLLDFWKRKQTTLAFTWDVMDFEKNEIVRPEWYGTKVRNNPVTGKTELYYPPFLVILKQLTSFAVIFFCILIVIISVALVIVYRVSSPNRAIVAAILNLTSITILGYIYSAFAKMLTDWENHRTATEYEDAMIAKSILFDVVNYYSSLFYIAYFQKYFTQLNAVLKFPNSEYWSDPCTDNSCLTDLMTQLAIIFCGKQFLNILIDIGIPYIRARLGKSKKASLKEEMEREFATMKMAELNLANVPEKFKEILKPPAHFEERKLEQYLTTTADFKEMVLQFGFATIFSAAFPLAPLFALFGNFLRRRADALKILKFMRKPIPFMAQDIGMWEHIMSGMSFIAVITNAFMLALASNWVEQNIFKKIANPVSSEMDYFGERLAFILIFEHVVFGIKSFMKFIIPDIPSNVKIAMSRKKYLMKKMQRSAGGYKNNEISASDVSDYEGQSYNALAAVAVDKV